MTATLVASSLARFIAAAVFVYIGYRMAQRVKSGRFEGAGRAFVLWWAGVAGFVFLGAFASILAATGVTALGVFVAWRVFSYLALCAGAGGLVYYLLYLYTGRRGFMVPVAVFYTLIFLALLVQVIASVPLALEGQRWRVDLVYETPFGAPYYLLLALLILPTTVGALAYFLLFFKTEDRLRRWRIALVSWSIAVWGLSSLLARIAENDWWQMFTRAGLGLFAALVILIAYEPPAGLRKRLMHQTPDDKEDDGRSVASGEEADRLRRARKQRALEERLRVLV